MSNVYYCPDANSAAYQPTTFAIQYADALAGPWTAAINWTLAAAPTYGTVYQTPIPSSAGAHRFWRMLATSNSSSQWAVYQIGFQVLLSTTQASKPALAISNGDTANFPALAAFDNAGPVVVGGVRRRPARRRVRPSSGRTSGRAEPRS